MTDRSTARELARRSLARGDTTGWFEELYQLAQTRSEIVPWSEERANPHRVSWGEWNRISGVGRRALVVGCGYGDDAEWLARLGFEVLAFDVSPISLSVARRRFPDSSVDYQVADVRNLPREWRPR